jgi:uncharacterized SAM-binding protein YcdF (DUF218 family)
LAASILDFLKDYARPTSPLLIVTLCGAAALWSWARPQSPRPRRLLLAVVGLFWFLSCPLGARLLIWTLDDGYRQVRGRDDAQGAEAVVVLGGGAATFSVGGVTHGQLSSNSVLRALEAVKVYQALGARLVVASAGRPNPDRLLEPESEMLRRVMVGAGVPADRILLETRSTNTREQAVELGPLLRAHGIGSFVVVTSPTHMRRALRTFWKEGLQAIPSPAPMRSDVARVGPFFLPNSQSLFESDTAVYDYAALLYYWSRGWLAAK